MVDNPIPTVALVLIYLATVMVIGPFWMRDRKPFNLKNTLIYYNAFQVILSGYMFYEVGSARDVNVNSCKLSNYSANCPPTTTTVDKWIISAIESITRETTIID